MRYLKQCGNVYWIRRSIHNVGEINFSLKTKDYNISIVRLSFLNYHIERILIKYKGSNLSIQHIRQIIKKYVDYITHPDNEYCDEILQREQELTTTIENKEYKGHSTPSLQQEFNVLNTLIEDGILEDMEKKYTTPICQGVLKILCQSDIIKYIRIDIDGRIKRESTV